MNQVALVTGAARGIGHAVAAQLAREGYAVCVNYLTHRDDAQALVSTLRDEGCRAVAVQADVADGEAVRAMAAWMRDNAEDNSEQLTRLQRNLRSARKQELTPRQNQMLELYFDRRMNMVEIAKELGVNPSTVSRTLRRAKTRLYRCLRYGL